MTQQCFYCSGQTEERDFHQVSFRVSDTDRDEILCGECYKEWLEGIKD